VKTAALENGSEFAEHEQANKELDLAAYFYGPCCSGQRA